MSQKLESVLDAARQLPLDEQRQLAARLLEDAVRAQTTEAEIEANLQIIERTHGWSPGFFEATAGAWQGETLAREPQGEYEMREELA